MDESVATIAFKQALKPTPFVVELNKKHFRCYDTFVPTGGSIATAATTTSHG